MNDTLGKRVADYVTETRHLSSLPSTTEETYYPAIRELLTAVLRENALPFEVRTGTSEAKTKGTDRPDFVLADAALFVGVYGEVKKADVSLEEMAASIERDDQIGRYLSRTGVVLITNVRGFGLLACAPGYVREPNIPVPPASRELIASIDLWNHASGKGAKLVVDELSALEFAEIVARSVTDYAPVAAPADLAKVLARQARDAREALPEDLQPVAPLLDDFRQALGLSFNLDDEKGDRFFRSSLIQTAFYSLFAAWVLWDRKEEDAAFDLEQAQSHLRIPFLEQLFYDLRHPHYLKELGLGAHLLRAVATLNRVDRKLFRSRMSFPTVDDENPAVAAITYFYEPFLEAFDPKLRQELGVWYTPPEIVRYQVRRIHHLLKAELGRSRGLADPSVVVLDPCCGTGAYLLEVARCIAEELRKEGDSGVVGLELLKAFEERVIGFELLTAPFAISQLQLYILLAELGVEPPKAHRLAVFLTNALTGWGDHGTLKLNFPEMRAEYDASQAVKHAAKIIVILGNPPYDRFTGAAQAEEADLVASYKGIELVEVKSKKGEIKHDIFGRPERKQKGKSLLYEEFGVRKQLLDDLYVRFFRLAEERIGEAAEHGIVSYISNSSYLTGRSHPIMRRSLLANFHKVWIDNLNGDKFKTGKIIPKGIAGEGTADQSAFTTDHDPRGIQPGTAIVTWLKKAQAKSSPASTVVSYRDFWGLANSKRTALLSSLPDGNPKSNSTIPAYEPIIPSQENRWRLSPHSQEPGYESWPGLDELFPARFQAVNPSRGLEGTVVDADRTILANRIRSYFNFATFDDVLREYPEFGVERANYEPLEVWKDMRRRLHFEETRVVPYLVFPFDQRWIYYSEHPHFLDRHSPEFAVNRVENEFLVTVPEPRKVSETRPLFANTLVGLHVHERGSVVIPRETRGNDLLPDRDANLAESVWRALRDAYGLAGSRRDADARHLTGRLLRVALAILHAPAYQADHRSALSADWAHLPIPKNASVLERLSNAGDKVARLLDANADAAEIVIALLGEQRTAALARLTRQDGAGIKPSDLFVAVNYWGGSKGKWKSRPFLGDEQGLPAWGERTGDLYISETVFFANVPEAVWRFELGGYPVLKKWLGYRQANRRHNTPISADERRWFRSMVQRIAALGALYPVLDELYSEASEDAFTGADLSIAR